MKYSEAKQFNPTMKECFFAFSQQQATEGKEKANIPVDTEIFSAGAGLYGTSAGLAAFRQEMDAHEQMIKDNCEPQDVYDYEFCNHECGYTGSDREALEITLDYFPGAEVKRFPAELMEDCLS